MDQVSAEPSQRLLPWKTVEWIQSPTWTLVSFPEVTYAPEWRNDANRDMLDIKDKIEELDKERVWELAKKMANPYELVYTHNDERLPPSISLVSPLSRSFFKMVEIAHVMSFFKQQSNKIVSAHIAEGPGGFIQALYNLSETSKKRMGNTIAMTLKPTNHHIPGWKKSFNFLQKYKQIQIHYGADGTGDVYKAENQASYITEAQKLGGAHIFTADGGFDFSNDYSLQEMQIFHLLLSSTTTGLRVLRPGGHFVLKLFECVSPHTKLFVLLLSRCFQSWTLYKPAMTRPCNSERYFLGQGLRTNINNGNSIKIILDALIRMESEAAANKYPVADLAATFSEAELAYLERHNAATAKTQIQHIKNAIHFAKNPEDWWAKSHDDVLNRSYEWCEFFGIYATPRTGRKASR
jgi:23S rRNA U2552 (ribose-2'-O)-methylase RlmE/FtsJ